MPHEHDAIHGGGGFVMRNSLRRQGILEHAADVKTARERALDAWVRTLRPVPNGGWSISHLKEGSVYRLPLGDGIFHVARSFGRRQIAGVAIIVCREGEYAAQSFAGETSDAEALAQCRAQLRPGHSPILRIGDYFT